jgi:ankyrin repeat protein
MIGLTLERGADPNVKAPFLLGETAAITAAASTGDDAAIRLLLDRGADPNARTAKGQTELGARI